MTMEKTLITNTADSNEMCFSWLNLVSIDDLCTKMVTDQELISIRKEGGLSPDS